MPTHTMRSFYYPLSIFHDYVSRARPGRGGGMLVAAYNNMPIYVDQWIAKMDSETPDYFFQVCVVLRFLQCMTRSHVYIDRCVDVGDM